MYPGPAPRGVPLDAPAPSPTAATAADDDDDKVIQLERSPLVRVVQTASRGRGVFASCDIPAKTLLEVSPILLVRGEEYRKHELQGTIFESYLFTWSRSSGDMALALGLGSLFNHDPHAPNVSFELDRRSETIRYTTSVNVKQGQELCIYYGHGVHFGQHGQLLVDLETKHGGTNGRPPETEEEAFSALLGYTSREDGEGGREGGEPADRDTNLQENSSESVHVVSQGTPSDGDEDELHDPNEILDLKSLPLEFVTRSLAPEDMPIELIEVCVLNIQPRETGRVMAFLGRNKFEKFEKLRHCRQVRRLDDGSAQVLVGPVDDIGLAALAELVSIDHELPPDARASITTIPSGPARTPKQLREWSAKHWPVSLIPIKDDVLAKEREKSWSRARLLWSKRMVRETVKLAREAKRSGELPISCIVGESWDPTRHTLAHPPLVLASSTDERCKSQNPLEHSVMVLLRHVAKMDLEDRRPPGLVNSDYLLTGLTVFMSHEPCLLCSMALLHSRIATLIYARPTPGAGGCGTKYALHEQKGTNHKFEVWRVKGGGEWQSIVGGVEELEVDP